MPVKSDSTFRLSVVSTVATQLVNILYGLILPRLVILNYGSEVNGVMASGLQLVGYLAVLEAGLTAAGINQLYRPIANRDALEIGNLLGTIQKDFLRISLLIGTGALLLAGFYGLVTQSSMSWARVFFSVVVLAIGPVIDFAFSSKLYVYFVASGQVFKYQRAQMISMVCKIAVVIAASRASVDPIALFTCLSAVSVVKALTLKMEFSREPFSIPRRFTRVEIRQRGAVLVHQLLGLVIYNTPTILVSLWFGAVSASVFSLNSMVFGTFYGFASMVFGQVLVPRLGHSIVSARGGTRLLHRRSVFVGTCLALSVELSTFVLLPSFLSLYVGGADTRYFHRSTAALFAAWGFLNVLKLPYQALVTASGRFRDTVGLAGLEAGVFVAVASGAWWWRSIDVVVLALALSCGVKMISLKVFCHVAILREHSSASIAQFLAFGSLGLLLWFWDPDALQAVTMMSWLRNAIGVFAGSVLVAIVATGAPELIARAARGVSES